MLEGNTQGEERTNKHRGLLEEVIWGDRGDKHIKLIAELQNTKTGSKEYEESIRRKKWIET